MDIIPDDAIGCGESRQCIGAEELENDSATSISVPNSFYKSSASNVLPRFIHAYCIIWDNCGSGGLCLGLMAVLFDFGGVIDLILAVTFWALDS